MQYTEARQGRIFVIRLEDGDNIRQALEKFATDHNISAAALIILGAADKGSCFVVGPADGSLRPIVPKKHTLNDVHEIIGTGSIFPDEEGKAILHMHVVSGRGESSITGCVRNDVTIWQVAEVILFELLETAATRRMDPQSGLSTLFPA